MLFLLQIVSQIILVVSGLVGLLSNPFVESEGRKRISPAGWILIACIVGGFILFVVTEQVARKQAEEAASAATERHAHQLTLLRSNLESSSPTKLEISWKASDRQWDLIQAAFEDLQSIHPEAGNWGRAGFQAYRMEAGHWAIEVKGVQERVEPWSGTTRDPRFTRLATVIDPILLNDLAIVREEGTPVVLTDRASTIRSFAIRRNGWIVVMVDGGDLSYALLRPGTVTIQASSQYAYRKGFLPREMRLVSHDPKLQLEQTFQLDWQYSEPPSVEEEEETVFKEFPSAPHTPSIILQSQFTWDDAGPAPPV